MVKKDEHLIQVAKQLTIREKELDLRQEEQNRKDIQAKREVAADSLQQIQLKILDLESMEGVSSELGPLQYLSELLDRPMNQIINWLIQANLVKQRSYFY